MSGGDGAPGGDARTVFPRVALLFLSRGPMPLEGSWRQFFESAGKVTQGAQDVWLSPQQSELSRMRMTHPASSAHAHHLLSYLLDVKDAVSVTPLVERSAKWARVVAGAGRGGARGAGWPQPRRPSRHVVAGQQLFSAYLHASPGFISPAGSLFAELQLEDPVQVPAVGPPPLLCEATRARHRNLCIFHAFKEIPASPGAAN